MQMVKLRDALEIMASFDEGGTPIPFSFTVVTLNEREKSGGRRVSYANATLAGAGRSRKNSKKNPNHWLNHTRNVYVPGKSRPITIHTLLITEFNGQKVFI